MDPVSLALAAASSPLARAVIAAALIAVIGFWAGWHYKGRSVAADMTRAVERVIETERKLAHVTAEKDAELKSALERIGEKQKIVTVKVKEYVEKHPADAGACRVDADFIGVWNLASALR